MIALFLALASIQSLPDWVAASWTKDRQNCFVTRYRKTKTGWYKRSKIWKGLHLPVGESIYIGADSHSVALNGILEGHRGILIDKGTEHFFIPLNTVLKYQLGLTYGESPTQDEPVSDSRLYGMEFDKSGKFLILMGFGVSSLSGNEIYSTAIVQLTTGKVTRFDGWFASLDGSRLQLRMGGGLATYDLERSEFVRNSASIVSLEKLFIHAGDIPFGRGADLDHEVIRALSASQSQVKGYAISSDIAFMQEMDFKWLGPPAGHDEEVDASNDYVLDRVFSVDGKTLWNFKRASVYPVTGFHFVNVNGAFMFGMQYPFWMGAKNLRSYKPGIFRVDPSSGAVERWEMPKDLIFNPPNSWIVAAMAQKD